VLFHKIYRVLQFALIASIVVLIAATTYNFRTLTVPGVWVACFLGSLLTFAFYWMEGQWVPANSIVVSADGVIKHSFKKKTFVAERTLDNTSTIILGSILSTDEMRVQPITSNPKVRDITYRVKVQFTSRLVEAPHSLFAIWRKSATTVQENVDKFVRQLCYDFNEQYSIELGAFYNPLDQTQQEKFSAKLREFLEPKLANVELAFDSTAFSC
jgi:hypothetical protein